MIFLTCSSYGLLASIPHRRWTAPLSNALSTACCPQSPQTPPLSSRLQRSLLPPRRHQEHKEAHISSSAIPRHDKEPALILAGSARQYHLVTATHNNRLTVEYQVTSLIVFRVVYRPSPCCLPGFWI